MAQRLEGLTQRNRASTHWAVRLIAVCFISLVLQSCGSSGDGGSGGVDGPVARVVIEPGSVLLPGINSTQTLQARAYNADGDELDVEVTWSSNDTNTITVQPQGNQQALITGQVSAGSAQLTAEVDGVTSTPVLALVATTAPNVLLVNDDQVRSRPQAVDPDADPGPGFLYRVILSDIGVEVGDVLLASGEEPISGRVIGIRASGGGRSIGARVANTTPGDDEVEVTLETVRVQELFTELVVRENIPLQVQPEHVTQAVAQDYDVDILTEGQLLFTLKDADASANSRVAAQPSGYGPFDCDTSDNLSNPISFNALPASFTLTEDLDFVFNYDSNNEGLKELSIGGDVKAEFKLNPSISFAFEGKAGCSATLVNLPVPLSGALSYIAGVYVPLKIGFEVGGKVTLANVGFEITSEGSAKGKMGYGCPTSTTCATIAELSTDGKAGYKTVLPSDSNLDEQLRFEPSLSSYVGAGFTLGSQYIQALQFNALELKAALVLGANLATIDGQVLDTGYQSDYKLSADLSLGFGDDGQQALKFLQDYGLVGTVAKVEIKSSTELFRSPEAATNGLNADVASFSIGDTVTFTVNLDPNDLDFYLPPGASASASGDWISYNISEVIIYRKEDLGGGTINSVEVTRTAATEGQTQFELEWLANMDGEIAENFYGFITTKALPLPMLNELELDKFAATEEEGDEAIDPEEPPVELPDPANLTITKIEQNYNCQTMMSAGYESGLYACCGAPEQIVQDNDVITIIEPASFDPINQSCSVEDSLDHSWFIGAGSTQQQASILATASSNVVSSFERDALTGDIVALSVTASTNALSSINGDGPSGSSSNSNARHKIRFIPTRDMSVRLFTGANSTGKWTVKAENTTFNRDVIHVYNDPDYCPPPSSSSILECLSSFDRVLTFRGNREYEIDISTVSSGFLSYGTSATDVSATDNETSAIEFRLEIVE